MSNQRVDAVAIRRAVDIFYEHLLADPALTDLWQGADMPRLKAHQRAFLIHALGGPALYSGRDMKSAHLGLGVSDAQFDRTVGYLVDSFTEVGVATDVIERATTDIERMRALVVEG